MTFPNPVPVIVHQGHASEEKCLDLNTCLDCSCALVTCTFELAFTLLTHTSHTHTHTNTHPLASADQIRSELRRVQALRRRHSQQPLQFGLPLSAAPNVVQVARAGIA